MSAPRFLLGLQASGRRMILRKLKTVAREVTPATVNELREELRQFLDSNLFEEYAIAALTALHKPEDPARE